MDLKLEDFSYDLPEDRIAKFPATNRTDSKLLCYQQGEISHHQFSDIGSIIPDDSLLVFNNTKVIPARVIMYKDSGARIEIFLLEPKAPSTLHEEVMQSTKSCQWKTMIGNAKKWKTDSVLVQEEIGLRAIRLDQDTVQFDWDDDSSFSEKLLEIGQIPLPPYLNRETEEVDIERYQTVYSEVKGAVAAPTAGLHFTDELLDALKARGILQDYLTLHVSAGTFQPIKADDIQKHQMHNEQIWLTEQNIRNILESRLVLAVGTTVLRTLESLYWYGIKLLNGNTDFFVSQNDPYAYEPRPVPEALNAVLDHMSTLGISKIGGHTEIFIYPGYDFKICKGLVTNYHLPGSTLILLVAAFVGDDWRNIYEEAISKDYRFLSYGDSSILLP